MAMAMAMAGAVDSAWICHLRDSPVFRGLWQFVTATTIHPSHRERVHVYRTCPDSKLMQVFRRCKICDIAANCCLEGGEDETAGLIKGKSLPHHRHRAISNSH